MLRDVAGTVTVTVTTCVNSSNVMSVHLETQFQTAACFFTLFGFSFTNQINLNDNMNQCQLLNNCLFVFYLDLIMSLHFSLKNFERIKQISVDQ